tara:strand:- start:4150 stop:5133 length:984 start_codon:yes stop_codon:yes gene_type:complete
MFYFPVPAKGADHYVVELPFFENIQIKESKKARYQKYSLISRSSNLYSYLGAESRTLSLAFKMTMPHILDQHPGITFDQYVHYQTDKDNMEAEKKLFKEPYKAEDGPMGMAFQLGTKYTQDLAKDSAKSVLLDGSFTGALNETDKHFIQSRYGISESSMNEVNFAANVVKNIASNPFNIVDNLVNAAAATEEQAKLKIENNQNLQLKYRIIDLIIYWTNIIRSSVVNYSKNPIYGPPVIRLRHGILYQDIPCICTDYSIDYNEAAGYDINTLLPRELKITMKLEEIRTGDFEEFDTIDIIKKDNLAGWEAVVLGDTHSMDPGSGGTT